MGISPRKSTCVPQVVLFTHLAMFFHLQKALYGLKEVPHAWFENFSTIITSLEFSSSPYDSELFTRITDINTILLYYMLMI